MVTKREKAEEFASEGYSIHLTGRHVLITEAMKNYAIEKISKIERFTTRIIDAQVTMDIQKVEHRVDIFMKVGHLTIKSHASTDDMYASIDKAVDKIQRQLTRYKKRLQNHHARPLEVVDMQVNVFKGSHDEYLDEINDAIEDLTLTAAEQEFVPSEVVARETMPLKVLTREEAIMKMDLSGDAFLLYREEANRKLRLIYRRTDGNYGIIEPTE